MFILFQRSGLMASKESATDPELLLIKTCIADDSCEACPRTLKRKIGRVADVIGADRYRYGCASDRVVQVLTATGLGDGGKDGGPCRETIPDSVARERERRTLAGRIPCREGALNRERRTRGFG